MDALSVHWEKLAALFSPPLRKTTAFKVFKKLGLPKDSRRRGYYLLDRSLEILKAGSLIQDSNRHFSAVESVRWALALIDSELFPMPCPPEELMPTKAMIQEIQCWIDQFNPDYLSLKTLADKMAFQAGMLDRAAEQDAQGIGLLVSPNH